MSIIKSVQSNGYVIYIITKKFNINILHKNIVYIVKKSYYKKIISSIKKYSLNILQKVSFLIIILLLI